MGEAKVKDFMSPSTDIVKTRSGVIEVALRATSIGLLLSTAYAASSCQGLLEDFVGTLVTQTYSFSSMVVSLSCAVAIYQLLALAQLFLRVKIAYASFFRWSLFYAVDVVAVMIIACSLLYTGVFMTIYSLRWSRLASDDADIDSIHKAAGTTTAFSYLSLLIFLGTIIFFYVARCKYRWTTHGEDRLD